MTGKIYLQILFFVLLTKKIIENTPTKNGSNKMICESSKFIPPIFTQRDEQRIYNVTREKVISKKNATFPAAE